MNCTDYWNRLLGGGTDGVHATTEFIDDVDLMCKAAGCWLWERVDVEGKILTGICGWGTKGGWGGWGGKIAGDTSRTRTAEETV